MGLHSDDSVLCSLGDSVSQISKPKGRPWQLPAWSFRTRALLTGKSFSYAVSPPPASLPLRTRGHQLRGLKKLGRWNKIIEAPGFRQYATYNSCGRHLNGIFLKCFALLNRINFFDPVHTNNTQDYLLFYFSSYLLNILKFNFISYFGFLFYSQLYWRIIGIRETARVKVCSLIRFFFFFKEDFTFYFYKFIYLFIYFWLCWVFVSVRGLSPVAASGGRSSSRCAGLSLSRPLLLRSTGSRCAGSVVVAHGPSCPAECGILPDQGSNPCPLHWQADSQPLRHQGSPW